MVDLRRSTTILSLIIGVFIVTPVFASENLISKPFDPVISNLPTFPKNEEIVLVIDGKVIKAEADQREITLTNFLKSKGSPLAEFAADFISVADKYDLDYRFLPAISGLESSWGQIQPQGSHNPFGWGPTIRFSSWPEAFETVGNGLRTRYVPNGKVTPFMVGPTYAASKTWASRVSSFMFQIENNPI